MTFCFRLPTVFLAECVLVYMEPEKSAAIIDWAGTNFKTALFINYEQVSLICSLVGEGYEVLCEERGGGVGVAGWLHLEAQFLTLSYCNLPLSPQMVLL